MNKIFVIGVGLIGGSFALDIRKKFPSTSIYGIDHNDSHLDEAITFGVIDAKATYADLKNADLVILSIPVDAAVLEST